MTKLWGVVLLSTLLFSDIQLPDNFVSDFTQMITNTKKKVIYYHGKIRFSHPKRFKWSYTSPTQKEVCMDGKRLLVVDHDLEQVSLFYISKGLDIVKVFSHAKHYDKNIYIASFDGVKYTIQLDSEEKVQSIAYFDELDNKVQIVFKNMHYGKGYLAKDEMLCNYPHDYDFIKG